jgi:hypothetical protein
MMMATNSYVNCYTKIARGHIRRCGIDGDGGSPSLSEAPSMSEVNEHILVEGATPAEGRLASTMRSQQPTGPRSDRLIGHEQRPHLLGSAISKRWDRQSAKVGQPQVLANLERAGDGTLHKLQEAVRASRTSSFKTKTKFEQHALSNRLLAIT